MLLIIQLVRNKRLDEKYALLWIVAGLFLIAAPVFSRQIDALSAALGFHYAPAFILLLGFMGLCLMNLQFSVVISRLNQQNRILAQKVAIMEKQFEETGESSLPSASKIQSGSSRGAS